MEVLRVNDAVIKFDKVDGTLDFGIKKGSPYLYGQNERLGLYFYGELPEESIEEILNSNEKAVFIKCKNQLLEKKDYEEAKDVIFLNFSEGTGFYGFMILGREHKLLIELSIEDYEDFMMFLSSYKDYSLKERQA